MSSVKHLVLIICGSFLLASLYQACKKETPSLTVQKYIAHMPLDASALVISEVADSLEVPWDLEVDKDGYIWFTQQKGLVCRVDPTVGQVENLLEIKEVFHRKSTGLLSMALHPDFRKNPYVFVHYTYAGKLPDLTDHIASRIVRYSWLNGSLTDRKVILDSIPGNTYHNGSRMLIASDGKLWFATGDAGKNQGAQDPAQLQGKVLRLNLDGSIPRDNPYPQSAVWSRGHRNIQGLASRGMKIYGSEHGPLNDDELNLIEKGRNYGWPDVQGYCDLDSEKQHCQDSLILEPLKAWTPTIAAAGLAYYNHPKIPEWQNSLLLATLKGQSLRVLKLSEDGKQIIGERIYFQKVFGRIRDITVNGEGEIFLSTSNMDWHPGHQPWMYDSLPTSHGDRIIRIAALPPNWEAGLDEIHNRQVLRENDKPFDLPTENWNFQADEEELAHGERLYRIHCAACHRPDGSGNIGEIPPLLGTEWVSGNTARLIDITLTGLNTPIEVNNVRYNAEMPGYKHLKDEEIRDILNFIRIEFGKVNGNIIAADVLHQRKGLP